MRRDKEMKKLVLFLCILLVLFLSACRTPLSMQNVHNEPHFLGVVAEVYDGAILVSVNDSEETHSVSDLVHVSLAVQLEDSYGNYMSGDEVIVYYDSLITDIYPAQINTVYAIVLISPSKLDDWIDLIGINVQHTIAGESTEYLINDNHQVDTLYRWFHGLILTKEPFVHDVTPIDSDSGEVYHFVLLHRNGDHTSFTYFTSGYLVYYDEWYQVYNPSIPFSD